MLSFSKTYKCYVLMVLTAVYLLSFMDRFMIGLFMQPIKEEFQLSDTQLGFLTGISFALFYAIMGIPIARWADRGNRVTITSLAIALWGVAVILCGMVTNFFQLILARIGSAVGEAGVMPPAYSLIADYFPATERARAVSIYMMAIPFSILISFLFAGWVGEVHGWRIAFFFVAVPGLMMALLVKFTLKEPRSQKGLSTISASPLLPFSQVVRILWRQRSFRYLLFGITLINFICLGVGQWYATFFIRNHGMALSELGLWLGLTSGVGGIIGIYLGGHIAHTHLAHDIPTQIRLAAIAPILFFLLTLAMLLSPSQELALCLLFVVNIVTWLPSGPMFAVILQLVRDKMRATAMAILSLALNLIGMGLGPQTVGFLSDILTPFLGEDALGTAMIIASLASFGVTYCYWIASQTVKAELLYLKRHDQSSIPTNVVEKNTLIMLNKAP